jgi:hypothetical protein
MSRSEKKSPIKGNRKEYVLLKPIIQKGVEVTPPSKVNLTDSQAKALKESDHIK